MFGYDEEHGGANGRLITASTLQSIYKSKDVVQVNLPAESGDMGVLANHVPSIEQLKAGLVEIIEESGSSKQYFRMFTEKPEHPLVSSTT